MNENSQFQAISINQTAVHDATGQGVYRFLSTKYRAAQQLKIQNWDTQISSFKEGSRMEHLLSNSRI